MDAFTPTRMRLIHPSMHAYVNFCKKRNRSVSPGQIPQIPIHQPSPDLCLGNMDQVPDHRIVQLVAIDHIPLQQRALGPAHLPAALLVDQQPLAELLGLDLQESSQLPQIHGGVEFEIRLDGRREHVGAHLGHEDAQVVFHRVDVDGRVVEVGRGGGDELRAGRAEEFFEEGEGFGPAPLESDELVAVFLAEGGVDDVVELGRVEGDADGDEGVHLLVALEHAVVLGVLLEVLRARDVHQDVAEHADRVRVAPQHHVAEADVVVCREVRGHHTREHALAVELDVVERFER